VVTGALIIGFGTSAPELVVSTWATLTEGAEGTALAIGNIVGSNVANLTLVLALPALVYGHIAIETGVKRQAALSAVGVTVFAAAVHLFEPTIWLGVTLGLLTLVALFMVVRLNELFGGVPPPPPPDTTEGFGPWIWTVVGLVGTVTFAVLVVSSATSIADDLGWTFNDAAGLPPWVLLFMVAVSWLVIGAMASSKSKAARISTSEAVVLILGYLAMLGVLAMTGATA
jgi:cation:H+ antiporter